MKNTKKSLSIIAVMLLTALIFSLGAVSASAQANNYIDPNDPYNYDIDGNFIPAMMEDFAEKGIANMRDRLSGTVNSNAPYCIFVDSQLVQYGFIDELVSALGVPGSTTDEKLAYLGENGHKIFVHRYDHYYEDIALSAYVGYALYDFDPEDENSSFSYLGYFLGTHYMCGFGIWNLPEEYFYLLDILQYYWMELHNVVMPVYVIERDEIQWGDGLIIKVLRACAVHDSYCLFDN